MISVERFGLVEMLDAAVEPPVGESETLLGILVIAFARRTFVEGHHDVCSDDALGVHHILRSKYMFAAIDMRTELATLLREFTDARKREYLKTAAVGKDGALPTVEAMQSAGFAENIQSGTKIKMVGIAEDNLCFDLIAQLTEMYTFHTAAGSYGHKDRCLDLTMVGGQYSSTCITGIITMFYLESHFFSSSSILNSMALSTISLVRAKSHTCCTFSTYRTVTPSR